MSTHTTRSGAAISVRGLRKSYGDHQVLHNLSFEVAPGTVYGLLGPNGAGKTTAVEILATLLGADGGEVTVDGHDVRTEPDLVKASIGVTGQFAALDELLTARQNLQLMADLRHLGRAEGRQRVQALLERFGIADAADRRASTFSGGMRRRLDLAMTLVGSPRVIYLDEPTTGLDPRSRRELWTIVRELLADGVTVLLTTQYLEEADQLADRIGLLDGGRLVLEGTAAELKRSVGGGHVRATFGSVDDLDRAAAQLSATTVDRDGLALTVPVEEGVGALRAVLADLDDAGAAGVSVHTPDLDDVFLAATGQAASTAPEPEEALR